MTTEKLTLPITVELDDTFFEDIIVTALEGGSNYWVDHITINHPEGQKPKNTPNSMWAGDALNRGGSVSFTHNSEENNILTKGSLINGLMSWATSYPDHISFIDGSIDAGNIDAGDADMILQYALFGEVVYR